MDEKFCEGKQCVFLWTGCLREPQKLDMVISIILQHFHFCQNKIFVWKVLVLHRRNFHCFMPLALFLWGSCAWFGGAGNPSTPPTVPNLLCAIQQCCQSLLCQQNLLDNWREPSAKITHNLFLGGQASSTN